MCCALQRERTWVWAYVPLPVVHNCVLLCGFQYLTIDTKSKAGNSRSSNSFVNVLKQRVCMHYIFITHTGSTGH